MIVFVHVPKTAGTTFRFVLENTFGIHHCHATHNHKDLFEQTDLDFAQGFFPGLRSIAGHNLVDPPRLAFPDPFFITLLRDPVSRVISHYQDSVERAGSRKTFEETLAERGKLENLAVKIIAGSRDLDKAKRFLEGCGMVGFTEEFDRSLHVLDRLCPAKLNLNYRRGRIAKKNTVRDSIKSNPRLLDIAREYNQLDLELYSFARNEVFPQLCAKAGVDPAGPVSSFESRDGGKLHTYTMGRMYNQLFRQLCKLRGKSK